LNSGKRIYAQTFYHLLQMVEGAISGCERYGNRYWQMNVWQ